MHVLRAFIDYHSGGDLMILGFFLTVAATVAGLLLDKVLNDRGFGMIGNGILILLGAIVGVVVAQNQGPMTGVNETNRIVMFSAASSGLVLVFFCLLKARFSPT